MLEVRKSTFTKNYENSFFREFSRHLYKSFKEKNHNGVLIGSPVCVTDSRLQIDALLITTSVVCIIDFKNFGGKIFLPDDNNFAKGLWKNDAGDQIKGGSSVNPFVQLKNQKSRFIDIFNKNIQKNIITPNKFNPLHLVRIVCFQEEVELIGKIPSIDSLNFLILDKTNFVEKIFDIIDVTDKEVQLNEEAFDSFKKIFRAGKYNFDDNPYEDKLKEISAKSTKHDYSTLYEDQKSALSDIKKFLEDPEQRIFILQGTTNSGKSHIIPFIQEIAYDTGIQETEIFAATGKVAQNLLSQSCLESVHSIYSYIYGGNSTDEEEELIDETNGKANKEIITESEEPEISEKIPLEIIPLKECDNANDSLFIVDESQLLADSYYESIDLRFGSGYLLSDFLKFTDLQSNKRKIIFIGDPFQLHSGKDENSSLNPSLFEEKYNIKVGCSQLSDKPEFSEINIEALKCIKAMRINFYNSLHFDLGAHFTSLNSSDTMTYLQNVIKNNIDCHYLCYTNEESQKINYWIKKHFVKNGEDIAPGDLVLFNNNIQVEDENDPFTEPKRIYNGQFAVVDSVSTDINSVTEKLKQRMTTLNFRELTVKLTESGNPLKILSLENYRISDNATLSNNETILFNILLNSEMNSAETLYPFIDSQEFMEIKQNKIFNNYKTTENNFIDKLISGKSRKKDLTDEEKQLKNLITTAKKRYKNKIRIKLRKDPSSKYYKLRNSARIRFGWAMTVHKSMSFKWDKILFNVSQGDKVGKTNKAYFNWLYTGITRARKKVNLIDYKHITPFDKTVIIDNNSNVKSAEIFFISDKTDPKDRLEDLKEFVDSKLLLYHIVIDKIDHLNFQERFILNKDNLKADISIGYDGHGKFKFPKFAKGDKEFGNTVIGILSRKSKEFDFSVIPDKWRKEVYENLSKILTESGIYFELIIQTKYKDKIKLFDDNNELEIEVDYKGDGAFSKISAKYYSDKDILEKFIKVVENLKS